MINLSLGGTDGPEIDPLEEAVNTLTAQTGTLFVIAAGNEGDDDHSVGSPGSADAALTVGAVDRNDELAGFSSRGPRVGDDGIKPDLTAPGVEIVAARAAGTYMGEPVGDHYVSASGTSMATPHVAGAAALLAQQHPDWTAERLKATLIASAKPNPALTAYQQGAGRVDVARAITQSVTTDPVAVSFGRTIWPHTNDEPITRTVTYRNSGTTPVTLSLALQVTGPNNAPALAGMFQLSSATVTVPAGGQAQVSVTADTSVESVDGYWTGRLLATAGSASVITALAVYKEAESYDLTLIHKDATGTVTNDYGTYVVGLDETLDGWAYDETGTVTLRLPTGRYGLTSRLFTPTDDDWALAVLAQPELRLTRDMTLTLDARTARPVQMSVPERSAESVLAVVQYGFRTADGSTVGFGTLVDTFDRLSTGNIGPAVAGSDFTASVSSQWAKRNADGESFGDSPYLYAVTEVVPGRLPTGLVRHFQNRELATVRQEFRGSAFTSWTVALLFPLYEFSPDSAAADLPISMPGHRTVYVGGQDVRWKTALRFETSEGVDAELRSAPAQYRAGRQYRDDWNGAPFGPAFPPADWSGSWITRQGGDIFVLVPTFSDAAGHAGFSYADTAGRTALYRNGKLVDETEYPGYGEFIVPPGSANYRLETSATRSNSDLSTRVDAAWTFQSGHVNGDDWVSLPVAAVRFTPKLSGGSSAPANRLFEIPVTVEYQRGVSGLRVKQLTVEVSYDDGRTWQAASVRAGKQGWIARVKHPKGSGYVSLRAKATDTAGNTVTQSIIHAYQLK